MAGNADLNKASKNKKDEFYTQLSDIEKEVRYYKDYFAGKVVFCNCDDPYESNFFKYFAMNFEHLGLKKLICTCYAGSPISHTELNDLPLLHKNPKMPYKIELTEVYDENEDGAFDLLDVEETFKKYEDCITILDGDGDFRSEEAIEFLKEADIIVTNPPFSLFREYIAQLMKYEKKFLIIGNMNAITYKEIFPLIKENKLWQGYTKVHEFIDSSGGTKKFGNIGWYTNLETQKRHEDLILYKKYKPEEFQKYDNYDAINVDKVTDIPMDYDGAMGVPITFLDKYNPDQFEIIDGIGRYSVLHNEQTKKEGKYLSMINGQAKYFRYIIKRRRHEN